ncbi:MAG: SEC-C domain-containing protein [Cytophagales bacterium]|nr:SEC-C domain-containing protein [Cytophaga sp.]
MPPRKSKRVIALNSTCPCGSGKQYKRCCNAKGIIFRQKDEYHFNTHFNRYESNIDHHYAKFEYSNFKYESVSAKIGRIKCRLVHSKGNSIIVPEFILLGNGGWIQPLFFTAPYLINMDNDQLCYLYIDIQEGETLKIQFYASAFKRAFSDKSHLYECQIFGPPDIEKYTCGVYAVVNDNLFLHLYHHTNDVGFDGINGSNSLWSSRWNYRGSKECINYNFLYFTHIPEIKYDSDLITVAMSKDGRMDYQIDSFNPPRPMPENFREVYEDYIYTAQVYRSTSSDRNCTIEFDIPIESIDLKHLYLHNQGKDFFYEVCFPYIHRIKSQPKSIIYFNNKFAIENKPPIIHSDYAIVGDTGFKDGLASPFEEEDTTFIFKIEDCGDQTIHEYWFTHFNTDLFSGKNIDILKVQEVKINPTNK